MRLDRAIVLLSVPLEVVEAVVGQLTSATLNVGQLCGLDRAQMFAVGLHDGGEHESIDRMKLGIVHGCGSPVESEQRRSARSRVSCSQCRPNRELAAALTTSHCAAASPLLNRWIRSGVILSSVPRPYSLTCTLFGPVGAPGWPAYSPPTTASRWQASIERMASTWMLV